MSIQEQFDALSDEELKLDWITAKRDLEIAADDEPNSEWHEACFAACLLIAKELGKRGIQLETVH